MLLQLVKAKAFPIGTIRKNKDGSWRVKGAKGWKYYAKGKLPKRYADKIKPKKKVAKKVIKPKQWDGTSVPTKSQVLAVIGERFNANRDGMPEWMLDIIGSNKWSIISNYSSKKINKIYESLNARISVSASEKEYNIYNTIIDLMRTNVAYAKGFTGKLKLHYAVPTKDGVKLIMYALNKEHAPDALPELTIDYSAFDSFIKILETDTLSKRAITKVKSSSYYKAWQVKGDPKLSKSLADFKKTTGLDIAAENFKVGKRTIQLRKQYIDGLTKVFKTISPVIDIKKYKPPDGNKLKVRVQPSGKKYVGMYRELDHTLNISPTYIGSITHEMGHYFWERSKPMQKEFIEWVKYSGLADKIEKNTSSEVIKSAKAVALESGYLRALKNMEYDIDKLSDKGVDIPKDGKEAIKAIANVILYVSLQHAKETEGKADIYLKNKRPFLSLADISEKDLMKLSQGLSTKFPELFLDANKFVMDFKKVQKYNNVKGFKWAVNDILKTAKDTMLWYSDIPVRNQIKVKYAKEASYWRQPTEIFARTFRNYVAWKGGHPFFETSEKQIQYEAEHKIDHNTSPYGWDFPEVSPDIKMLRKGGRLSRILKKYIGNSVIKSILSLIAPLEKAKYIHRWKDKNGKWRYSYNKPKNIRSIADILGKPISFVEYAKVAKMDKERAKKLVQIRSEYTAKMKRYLDKVTQNARVIVFEKPEGNDLKFMVHPSSREKGKWQISIFSVDGKPTSHYTCNTKKEAIYKVMNGGLGDYTYGISKLLKSRYVVFLKEKRKLKNGFIK